MIKDPETGSLIPKIAKTRDGKPENEITVSRTMIDQVLSKQLSVLVYDAQQDVRFKQAQSLILKGDTNIPYGRIVKIMDIVKKSGVKKLIIATRQGTPEKKVP